jgi:hypothetical protein
MSKKIYQCGLIGGIIVFVWGMAFSMLFPWHKTEFKKFSCEKSVKYCIENNAPESGLYQLPSVNYKDKQKKMDAEKRMQEGPYAFVAVRLEGKQLGLYGARVAMFLVDVIVATIVTWLLFQTRLHYKHSLLFLAFIGLAFGLMHAVPMVIWVGFPAMFAFMAIIKSVSGWMLAGLAISKIAKR